MNPRHLAALFVTVLLVVAFVPVDAPAQELSAESLHNQAYNQFWDGEYKRAESTFRTITERFPDSSVYWDARYGLARSLNKQGKLEPAARHFREVRRNHPEKSVRGDALFGQVEVAILRDKTIRAEQLLRTFLTVFSDHVLEPTAREQLELLEEIDRSGDRSGTSTSSPEANARSDGPPEQPRLKPSGDGDTRARDLIEPEPSQGTTSDTASAETPGMRRETPEETGPSDTSGTPGETPSQTDRISPFGPVPAGTEPPGNVDTEPESPDRSEDPASKTSGGTGLIGPEDLAGTSSEPVDRDTPPERTDTAPEVASGDSPDTPTGVESDTSGTTGDDRAPEEAEQSPREETTADRLKRVRSLAEEGSVNEARALIDTVLESGEPGPEAYFLGARVYAREPARTDKVLDYVNRALRGRSDPPARYHFLKTESLLDSDRNQEALASLNNVDPESLGENETEVRARYYYLMGTISLRLDQSDEAFFHFMDAVRAAPSSRWAEQSRQIIQDRL